jgi:hypothetical protein
MPSVQVRYIRYSMQLYSRTRADLSATGVTTYT